MEGLAAIVCLTIYVAEYDVFMEKISISLLWLNCIQKVDVIC